MVYARAPCPSVCLVCLSVTSWCSVKTIALCKQCQGTLVFWCQSSWWNSNGVSSSVSFLETCPCHLNLCRCITEIMSSVPGVSLNSLHVNLSVTLMPTHPSSDCHHSTLKCQLVLTLWPYFTANHTHNFSSSSETNTSALLNYESWQDSTELKYATCWQSSVPDGLSTVFLQFIILQVLSAVISHRTLLYASAPLVNIQNCSCPSDCSMGWLTQ